MSDPPKRRSRFDVKEPPERQAADRRRSRSPPSRAPSDDRRTRSPQVPHESDRDKSTPKPNAAAAAAIAKLNASIGTKRPGSAGGPPVRPPNRPSSGNQSPTSATSQTRALGEIYEQDGDFIKDIDINDLRNRYTLTKGPFQREIMEETGADVTTRGQYVPDRSMATPNAPPLHLHVTSKSKEGLENAIAKIESMIKQDLPNLVDERRFRRREPEQVERDDQGRRKWPDERIQIDLEPIPGFNLRAQVVGQQGAYVKHVQSESGCRVQIKGRGSGFIERDTGLEADEPMYLHVAGPDPSQVEKAKELCESLLEAVRKEYEEFKERSARPRDNGPGNRGGRNGGGYGGQRNNNNMNPSATPTVDQNSPEYAEQWAAYLAAGGDPYVQYGGYDNYMRMMQEWQSQQAQAAGGQAVGQGQQGQDAAAAWAMYNQQQQQQTPTQAAPPPPPADDDAPPPPPPPPADDGDAPPPPPPPPGTNGPPGAGSGSYARMPPPPGM